MASKAKSQAKKIKIPPLQLALVLLLVMVVIGGVFYFFVMQPKTKQIKAVSGQIAVQNGRLAELQETRSNLLAVMAKADRLEKRFKRMREKLPESQDELNEFLSAISQRAQNARIARWTLFEQQEATPSAAEGVDAVPINMTFISTYDAAAAFFWELSEMGEGGKAGDTEQIVNISNISVVRDGALDPGLVKVSCTAETFLYRPPVNDETDKGKGTSRRRRGGRK